MLGTRNRELVALIPAALLVTAGFAAIFIQSQGKVSSVSLTYGAAFLALCLAAHLVIRRATPFADPYLFPLAAMLASVGIVELYRIGNYPGVADFAREQGQWMVVGLVLFSVTLVALRDGRYMKLENYRYLIAIVGVAVGLRLWTSKAERPPLEAAFLRNSWYINQFYDAVIGRPSERLATFSADVIDTVVIDGGVNGVATLVRKTGSLVRRTQTGYVRNYVLGIVLGTVLILAYMLTRLWWH